MPTKKAPAKGKAPATGTKVKAPARASKAPAKAKPEIRSEIAGGTAVLTVNKTLYPSDVLFGTALTFLDRAFVHLDVADKDRLRVEITARPGQDAAAVAGEFKNEMVTQVVRLRLARQTEKVRAMIVSRAIMDSIPAEGAPGPGPTSDFAPDLPPEVAKILAEEEDSLDFLDDPLGIAVPWEEKYGKKDGSTAAADGKDPSPKQG